ncbi:hypothetical protein D3C76_1150880 [compost metagenome]
MLLLQDSAGFFAVRVVMSKNASSAQQRAGCEQVAQQCHSLHVVSPLWVKAGRRLRPAELKVKSRT